MCRDDPNKGSCKLEGGYWVTVESCCRNDGKRNFEEGRISEREYIAIEETNAMLDIHLREYEDALANGTSIVDMEALREVQKRELKFAEMKQLKARQLDVILAS